VHRRDRTRSTYPNVGIVIVDNDSQAPETLRYLDATRHQVVRAPGSFNFSRVVNLGVRASTAPYVLLLNNDAFVRVPDWLERLLEHAQRPEVGAVGCQLRYPNGDLQHCGVGLGHGHIASTARGQAGVRNVSAVTAACMMLRREVFDEVGGFDERFAISFNDVDLCMRITKRGYRIIYNPHVWLEHDESASRGRLHPEVDIELFRSGGGPSTRWSTRTSAPISTGRTGIGPSSPPPLRCDGRFSVTAAATAPRRRVAWARAPPDQLEKVAVQRLPDSPPPTL